MLRFAIEFKDELQKSMLAAIYNPENRFYFNSNYIAYVMKIDETDWDTLQMVSVSKDSKILGYFKATFDRTCMRVNGLAVISFAEKCNIVFAKDMYQFLDDLFILRGMNKVEWTVVVGNPIEAMYDRIIKHYGGHIVGIKHASSALMNGTYCDSKIYELMRTDYLMHRRISKLKE